MRILEIQSVMNDTSFDLQINVCHIIRRGGRGVKNDNVLILRKPNDLVRNVFYASQGTSNE